MSKLGAALRTKYSDPKQVLQALGLDAALLTDLHSKENTMTKPTRFAAFALGMTAATVAPLMAMDAKIELPKSLFNEITQKNFTTKKAELLAGVRKALDGKLRKGFALDASMAEVGKVMDTIGGLFDGEKGADESVSEEQHKAMEAAAHGESNLGIPKKVGEEFVSKDAGMEGLKGFLKEKGMADDDIMKACDMAMPKAAVDEDPDEKKKAEEEEKKAKDKKAADEKAENDEKEAKDAEMKNMVTKPAMDAAITTAVEATAKKVRETERGIRTALDFIRPWTGELPVSMAFDSADDVYRHAAVMLEIPEAKTIHPSAIPTIIKMLPRAGARPVDHGAPMAMDAAATKDFADRFPGADRIKAA